MLPAIAVSTILLVACAPAGIRKSAAAPAPATAAVNDPFAPQNSTMSDQTRVDQQGAVTVEVTPLNLSSAEDKLEFEVALNTHSVALTMDLAPLAALSTDTGITVQAALWDAPRGGHHVTGRLEFPAIQAGRSILEGAKRLTLTINEVDAATRRFEWDLK